MNERLCSLGGMFGAGIYLAEDVEKIDQYTTPDESYEKSGGVGKVVLRAAKMREAEKEEASAEGSQAAPSAVCPSKWWRSTPA